MDSDADLHETLHLFRLSGLIVEESDPLVVHGVLVVSEVDLRHIYVKLADGSVLEHAPLEQFDDDDLALHLIACEATRFKEEVLA